MIITILSDNEKSWFIPFGRVLKERLENLGNEVKYIFNKNDILTGDICFFLSCSRIVEEDYLKRNKNNIVVHASDLPKGKGFAPLQWQILKGENEITLTLFEVIKDVDTGPYYLKDKVTFDGKELYKELRACLADKIIEMCVCFVKHKNELKPVAQTGEGSFYRRRSLEDDELDPNKTIMDQFNHFRIADNENHPLYFYFKEEKYILKIYKENKD